MKRLRRGALCSPPRTCVLRTELLTMCNGAPALPEQARVPPLHALCALMSGPVPGRCARALFKHFDMHVVRVCKHLCVRVCKHLCVRSCVLSNKGRQNERTAKRREGVETRERAYLCIESVPEPHLHLLRRLVLNNLKVKLHRMHLAHK
eukprot:5962310-Pleurochrysis_carterae.AAC.2